MWTITMLYHSFMVSLAGVIGANPTLTIQRSSPQRHTNWMEEFQTGYVQSVAAAAGCQCWVSHTDLGIDVKISRLDSQGVADAEVDLQLKAVTSPRCWNADRTRISAYLSKKRYNMQINPNTILPNLVLIMEIPKKIDEWITSTDQTNGSGMVLSNCCYWVSLLGCPCTNSSRVKVSAPSNQVFDDAALCMIMEKISKGMKL